MGQGTWLGGRPACGRRAHTPAASHPLAVMEARISLEPALAALAAVKATAADIAAIARCAARGAETSDEESWGHWDAHFHRAVASACGNPLLRDAFDLVEACRARTEWGRLREAIATAAMRRAAAAQHARVAEAIARRDADAARAAMWSHLRSVSQAIESAGAGPGQGTAAPRDPILREMAAPRVRMTP